MKNPNALSIITRIKSLSEIQVHHIQTLFALKAKANLLANKSDISDREPVLPQNLLDDDEDIDVININ